jgi:hypothetical protein
MATSSAALLAETAVVERIIAEERPRPTLDGGAENPLIAATNASPTTRNRDETEKRIVVVIKDSMLTELC